MGTPPRWQVEYTEHVPGILSTVTQPTDPAMALLADPNVHSTPVEGVYRDSCYICVDPEFAAMGLPLCKPCPACSAKADGQDAGHVPADDVACTDCGFDLQEFYERREHGGQTVAQAMAEMTKEAGS